MFANQIELFASKITILDIKKFEISIIYENQTPVEAHTCIDQDF